MERLLIVGYGSIGRRHARLARSVMPGVQITVLRHEDVSADLPVDADHVTASLAEALARAPQAAVIASPATHHLAVAMRLAGEGVHLLVEKPIAAAPAGVEELVALCARRSVTLMTGYNLRFLPSLQFFRDLILNGAVGRVLSVRAEAGQHLLDWRPLQDYRETVSARASLGGGVLLELSHEFDYLCWIFGEVEWVQAVVGRQSALDIDVEDTAHMVLGFASTGQGPAVIASLSLDCVRHDSTRGCLVIGSEGTLRWNAITGTVDVARRGRGWDTLLSSSAEPDGTYIAELRHFLSCIAGASSPLVSGADGLRAVRIVEAARKSSLQHARVDIGAVVGGAAEWA